MGMPESEASESPSAPVPTTPRIKRNTACVNCRDSKVKCNASSAPHQPCLRCRKLGLTCVVDRSHKRVSRRSKLEELQQEVRSIKEAVGKTAAPAPAPPLGSASPSFFHTRTLPPVTSRGGGSSLVNPPTPSPYEHPILLPPVLTPSGTSATPKTQASVKASEPRALKSRVFSGDDITFYFEKYFDHFHHYFPIIRCRDPDKTYETSRVLFWVIISISARRYARDDTVIDFFEDNLLDEVWRAVSNPPLRVGPINALLLLCSWPLSSARFIKDPSPTFAAIAMSSCLSTGLHTGRGEHPELLGPTLHILNNDEEATYTWAGYNFISQRVSVSFGCPPTGQLFNKTIENLLDGTSPYSIPPTFQLGLECARFSNRLGKTACASLEEDRGISHHLINMFEEEFDKVQRLLVSGTSEIDYWHVLSTILEIQAYYFMPHPDLSPAILKTNLLKAYNTSQLLLRLASKLQEQLGFLLHAPHFVCRSLLTATCIMVSVLPSHYMKDHVPEAKDTLVQEAFWAIRTCSIRDGDLPFRTSNMLESYWSIVRNNPPMEVPTRQITDFSHRLGTSLAFDFLRRWKKEAEACRATTNKPRDQDPSTPAAATIEIGNSLQADPAQMIDWDAFLEDFDWSFTPNYLNPI